MPIPGAGHLWLIGILLVVVLIVWGPSKLPEVGSGLGRAMNEFRRASSQARDEFSRMTTMDHAPEHTAPAAEPAPVAVAPPPAPPEPPAAPPSPPTVVAADERSPGVAAEQAPVPGADTSPPGAVAATHRAGPLETPTGG